MEGLKRMMDEKPFVLPIKTPLGYYIYEVNRNEILSVNKDLYQYILMLCQENSEELEKVPDSARIQFNELREYGYLAPSRIKKIEHPLTNQLPILMDRAISKLALQVTQSCNLRCKYCIYSEYKNLNQRSHSTHMMNWETAKRALEFYRQHIIDTDEALIGFYGGEPLLAFPLIKKVVEYAEELFLGREITYFITTNATLLTDEIIDFLLKYNFRIAFSLDGPQKTHDRNRVFKNGQGSYKVVMDNIEKLYNADPDKLKNTAISMVIDSEQNYNGLMELFNVPILKNTSLTYAMVEENSVTKQPSSEYLEGYNYDYFLSLIECFRSENPQYKNKLLKHDMDLYMSRRNNIATKIITSIAAPSGTCVPGKLRLLVNCFGDFYPCEKVNESESMKIGSLDTGFDLEKISQLLNVGQLEPEECKKCWALPLCSVCARHLDNQGVLSVQMRRKACIESKNNAYALILQKILIFENARHVRNMNTRNLYEGNEK